MIDVNQISINNGLKNKDEVFRKISEIAVENNLVLSEPDLISALYSREKEASTGMIDGFAIPHAQDETIQRAAIIVIKNNQPIKWGSLDGSGITFIVSLLIPEKIKAAAHLPLLTRVSKMLMKKETRARLQASESKDELLIIFQKNIYS